MVNDLFQEIKTRQCGHSLLHEMLMFGFSFIRISVGGKHLPGRQAGRQADRQTLFDTFQLTDRL